ncbi:MAG: peptide-methionine (S)-S-oxide reductase, partial [Nitrospira sp.]|nr:peptide-methionine (S)-S-oxide reductase [Nitrospira sp.]
MRRRTALSVLTVTILLFGAWSLQPTSQAASDVTKGKAYFAGGCFWCMEEAFEKVEGVSAVTSGYMGGTVVSPSYEAVSAGRT